MFKIIKLFKYFLLFNLTIISINYVKTNDPPDNKSEILIKNSKKELFGKLLRKILVKYSNGEIQINEENELVNIIELPTPTIVALIKGIEDILTKKFIKINTKANRGIECRETTKLYLDNGGFYLFLWEANLIKTKPTIWETEPIKEKLMFKWFFEFFERLCYNLGNYLIEMTNKSNKYETKQPLSVQFVKAIKCLDLFDSEEEEEEEKGVFTEGVFEMAFPDSVKIYFDMKENCKDKELVREDNLLTFKLLSEKSFWIGELFWTLEWISHNWMNMEDALNNRLDEDIFTNLSKEYIPSLSTRLLEIIWKNAEIKKLELKPDIVILKFGTRLAGRLLRLLTNNAILYFNQPLNIKIKLENLQAELKDKFNIKNLEYAQNNLSVVIDELVGSEVFIHFEEALNIKWHSYNGVTII
uniref:Uncharacterized protein n=1 Tax=Meloidogyne enterolobii TaxID=390850 RepID=A0A6V7VRT9_MELEN|nr:unnamed protein product [Meloidogyne enterolobii]